MPMKVPEPTEREGGSLRTRSDLLVPAGAVLCGCLMAAAGWLGGHRRWGLAMFAIMAVYALAVHLGGRRWDLIRVLGGRSSDERWRLFDLRATAFAGIVLMVAVSVAFLLSVAQGGDGSPYAQMGALAGLAYVGSLWVQSRRS